MQIHKITIEYKNTGNDELYLSSIRKVEAFLMEYKLSFDKTCYKYYGTYSYSLSRYTVLPNISLITIECLTVE